MHTKPSLLKDVELALQQVLFGTAAGAFRAEPALKAVLDYFCPILASSSISHAETLWFPNALEQPQVNEDNITVDDHTSPSITSSTPAAPHLSQPSMSGSTTSDLSLPRRSNRNRKPPPQDLHVYPSNQKPVKAKKSQPLRSASLPDTNYVFLSEGERSQILKSVEKHGSNPDEYQQLLLKAGPIQFGKLRAMALVPVVAIPHCKSHAPRLI